MNKIKSKKIKNTHWKIKRIQLFKKIIVIIDNQQKSVSIILLQKINEIPIKREAAE